MKTNVMTLIFCIVTTITYAQDLTPFKDGNGKYGYKNSMEKEVVAPRYTYAQVFSDNLAQVGLNNKYGFIDETGKEVILLKYDGAGEFNEGLARVHLNYKYGFINKTGKEQIPLMYQDAKWFSEGLAAVKSDGKWGFINTAGKTIVPFRYDDIGGMQSFYKGKVKVKLGDRYFDIDKNGNELK